MNKSTWLFAGLSMVAATSCAEEEPKNVIYILADDLGFGDLSILGQTKFETPNIDRLAREGVLFTQHYAGSTVSAPSRSVLMTGQHTGHTCIRGNREQPGDQEGQEPIADEEFLMPELFKQAGYATACFGKWGLGYPSSEGDPLHQGFDRFYGYNCQREAHRYYPLHLWDDDKKILLEGNRNFECRDYAPDLTHAKAMEFIEQNSDKPMFLFLSYVLPHAEMLAPDDEILARFAGKFNEEPYKAQPGGDYGEGMSIKEYCSQDQPYAHFAAMVTRFDTYVGELMAKLEEEGIADKTIIFFSSDNGPHQEGGANPAYFNSNGPFKGGKRDLYEGGIRTPLIAWAPGYIREGVRSDHLCAMWDMMPTFAEILGMELPGKCDGISILPTLTGRGEQQQHTHLYWEFHEQNGKIAIRMGNWKGVIRNVLTDPQARLELYDLTTDIHEDHNLAEDYPRVVEEIIRRMKESRTPSEIFEFDIVAKQLL